MNNGHDDEHDAWLREALRHAPDALVTPPASVSELILREAQAKARSAAPAAAVPRPTGFAAFWAWLARPQVAAGAASVMIATVAGVMWWDRPVEDYREPVVAQAPAPAAAPATPAAEVAADARAPQAPMREEKLAQAESAAKRAAPSRDAKGEQSKQRTQNAAGRSADEELQRRQAPLAQPEPRAFPATPGDRPPATAAGAVVDSATATTATKPNPPAAPPAPVTMAPELRMAKPAPAPSRAREQSEFASSSELQKSARSLAAPAPADIAELRRSLASEPQRWTWQRGAGSPQPANERLRNWLAQVDAAIPARWQQSRTGALGAAASAPTELRLWRDGRLAATLHLGGGMLRLESPATESGAASVLQAPIDAATLQTLEQSAP
jgi:hypothetical protein